MATRMKAAKTTLQSKNVSQESSSLNLKTAIKICASLGLTPHPVSKNQVLNDTTECGTKFLVILEVT